MNKLKTKFNVSIVHILCVFCHATTTNFITLYNLLVVYMTAQCRGLQRGNDSLKIFTDKKKSEMYDGQVYLAPFTLIPLKKMIETVVTEEKYIILEKKICSYFVTARKENQYLSV